MNRKPLPSNFIAGYHPIKEQILKDPAKISKILIATHSHSPSEIIKLAKEKNIPFHFVPKEKIKFLTGHGENLAALVSLTPLLDAEDLRQEAEKASAKGNGLFVILDEITDPQNLGAIIRSAVCFSADGIVIQKWRAATVTDAVYKSSAGAVPHIKIFSIANIKQAILILKELNYTVVGSSSEGTVKLDEFSAPERCALVIGSEENGIRKTVGEMCDAIVRIPQPNSAISSLNASVAAGILLYALRPKINNPPE